MLDDLGGLMRHNMYLRFGSMMLNCLDLLVHSRFLGMNDGFGLCFVTFFLWVLVPGCVRTDPGLWAGGGVDDVVPEPVPVVPVPVEPVPVVPVPVVPLPVEPVPVVPLPVEPVPVVPVPVEPVPVEPLPVEPVPVEPVPVVPVPVWPAGWKPSTRYDKGAAKGMSLDWPSVAMIVPGDSACRTR